MIDGFSIPVLSVYMTAIGKLSNESLYKAKVEQRDIDRLLRKSKLQALDCQVCQLSMVALAKLQGTKMQLSSARSVPFRLLRKKQWFRFAHSLLQH